MSWPSYRSQAGFAGNAELTTQSCHLLALDVSGKVVCLALERAGRMAVAFDQLFRAAILPWKIDDRFVVRFMQTSVASLSATWLPFTVTVQRPAFSGISSRWSGCLIAPGEGPGELAISMTSEFDGGPKCTPYY